MSQLNKSTKYNGSSFYCQPNYNHSHPGLRETLSPKRSKRRERRKRERKRRRREEEEIRRKKEGGRKEEEEREETKW